MLILSQAVQSILIVMPLALGEVLLTLRRARLTSLSSILVSQGRRYREQVRASREMSLDVSVRSRSRRQRDAALSTGLVKVTSLSQRGGDQSQDLLLNQPITLQRALLVVAPSIVLVQYYAFAYRRMRQKSLQALLLAGLRGLILRGNQKYQQARLHSLFY